MKSIKVDMNAIPETLVIEDQKLRSGEKVTQLWNAFSDKSGRFNVGHWQSGTCEISVNYTEDELCVIVKGEVILTSSTGESVTYKAGDAFVIPAGFQGTWASLGEVQKIYASYE